MMMMMVVTDGYNIQYVLQLYYNCVKQFLLTTIKTVPDPIV